MIAHVMIKKLAKGEIEGKECARGKPIKRGKCQFLLDFIFPPLEEVSLSHLSLWLKLLFNPVPKTKIITHISSGVITFPSLSRHITPTRSSGAAFDNIRTRLNSGFNYRSDKYRVSHSMRQSFNVFSTLDLTIEAHHPTFPFGVLKVSPYHYQFVTASLNIPLTQ